MSCLPTDSPTSSPCTTTAESIQSSAIPDQDRAAVHWVKTEDELPTIPDQGRVAVHWVQTEDELPTIPDQDRVTVQTRGELPNPIDEPIPTRRLSYTREEKLHILKFYYENGCNKYKTCQKFGIAKPSLNRWIEIEDEIEKGKTGSKRVGGGGRRAFWPDVEEKLAAEFKLLRQKGLKMKQHWFRSRAFQLMNEMHPDVIFRFSPGWFDRFKARNDIRQKPPSKSV